MYTQDLNFGTWSHDDAPPPVRPKKGRYDEFGIIFLLKGHDALCIHLLINMVVHLCACYDWIYVISHTAGHLSMWTTTDCCSNCFTCIRQQIQCKLWMQFPCVLTYVRVSWEHLCKTLRHSYAMLGKILAFCIISYSGLWLMWDATQRMETPHLKDIRRFSSCLVGKALAWWVDHSWCQINRR